LNGTAGQASLAPSSPTYPSLDLAEDLLDEHVPAL